MDQAKKFRKLLCNQEVLNDLRTKSVRAAAFTGAAAAGDFAIRLTSTAVLARLVLPEQFGLVMMVMAVTAIAEQFRDLGLSSATVQSKEITHQQVSNLFWINVSVGILSCLVLCAASPLVSAYYREPRLAAITCILATNFVWGGLMVQHQALLTRQLKLGYTSTIRLSSSLVSTVFALLLAWKGFGYWALVWREVVRSILLTAGMWACFPWLPGLPCKATSVRALLGFGVQMSAANITGTLSAGIDRFLLGRFCGASPVAIYRQAYQLLVAPIDQLLSPVYQVTQPGLSMVQSEDAKFRIFYRKVLTAACVAAMPLSLFVAVFSREITRIVLGRKWLECAPLLLILSLGTFMRQPIGSAAFVLISRGRSRVYLGLSIAHHVTLIVFMLIGVHWGTTGVAVAEVATTYSLIAPNLYFSFKGSPVPLSTFFSGIFRPACASIVMAFALFLLHSSLPPVGAPLALIFAGTVAAFTFPLTWLCLPGGVAELTELFSDVRAGFRRKTKAVALAQQIPAAT